MRNSFLAFVLLMSGLGAPVVSAQERPLIIADSYPVAWFAERLVGEAAEVRLPFPNDRDPAFWRPSIAEIADIQAADLIVLNGSGFADWTTRVSLPRSRTADTGRGLEDDLIATEVVTHSHGGEGEHSHEDVATYTWLDFELAARQATTLATTVKRTVPDAAVDENLRSLLDDLSTLDALGQTLPRGGPPIIASHPRYPYLAKAYGLEINSLDWDASVDPTAEQLNALRTLVDETGAQVFMWEAEPTAAARAALDDIGLVQTVFPPLATRPAAGDFLLSMQNSLKALAQTLQDAAQ